MTATAEMRARIAISVVFLVNGMALAAWISRIPYVTDDLDLSNAQLGMALMCLAAGALVAFPIAGKRIQSHSSRGTTLLFTCIMLAAVPLIAFAPSLILIVPCLFLAGFGSGGMDVSMNSQGVEVKRFYGRPILSGLHGFFSLGAFISAGIGALAAHFEVDPPAHFLLVSAICAVLIWRVYPWLIEDEADQREHESEPMFALPPRALWPLGAVVLAVAIGEGAMADWGALYLKDHLHQSGGVAAFGFAAFSLAMLIGRFGGDMLSNRFGPVFMVRFGGLLAGIGLATATIVDTTWSMMIGFVAVGFGVAHGFPIAMRAAAHHPTISRGRAVAAVATIGYTGFLVGPPILGWIAEFTSLQLLMLIVATMAGLSTIAAKATAPAIEEEVHAP